MGAIEADGIRSDDDSWLGRLSERASACESSLLLRGYPCAVGLFGSKSGERVSAQARIVDLDVYNNIGGSYQAVEQSGPSERQIARDVAEKLARFHVLITPPDGGQELSSRTPKIKGNGPHITQINWARGRVQTYVLYDPGHPSHCEIDTDRLEREYGPIDGPDGPEHRLAIPSPSANIELSGDTSVLVEGFKHAQRPAGGDDEVDELNKLAELHSSGALTDAEFAAAKTRLLGA